MEEIKEQLDNPSIKEITKESVISVSSSRIGFGINNICDNNLNSYWQSNGERPHQITFFFDECFTFAFVRVYVSQSMDESYTPSKIILKIGNSTYDLIERVMITLEEPEGWYYLTKSSNEILKGCCIQIEILENCSLGRDSRIRQVEVYAYDQNGMFD